MTFRFRIISGYAVLLCLTLAALILCLRVMVENAALRQLDARHAEEAGEVVSAANEVPPGLREQRLIRHMRMAEGNFRFLLADSAGRIVYSSSGLEELPDAGTATGVTGPIGRLGPCRVTTHPVEGYTLRVFSPVSSSLALTRHFYEVGLVVLAAGLALSLVTGVFYSRWVLRPLILLEEAAGLVGTDALGARIPDSLALTNDEVGRIARRLNTGYDRIAESVGRIRLFSAEVSHELRTPLSIMRLNAERIRAHPGVPEPVSDMAAEQLAEIERMNRVVANLLGFARLDAGAVSMEFRQVALAAWLADFAEDATLLAEDAGRRFEVSGDSAATVRFDPVWMRQVLFNLLGNALRFSPKGGLIRLTVEAGEEALNFVLEDEGPGVPPDKLEAIFERYVRFGEGREPGEGFGLGLAICRSVVGLHGGVMRAENRSDRSGLRVIVRLPRRRDEA